MPVDQMTIDALLLDLQALEDVAVESMQQAVAYRQMALVALEQAQTQRKELTILRRRLREFVMSDADRLAEDEARRAVQGE